MLSSKIISRKKIISKTVKQKVTDLIYSTFSFPISNTSTGLAAVNDFENMRPDLMANRIYGDQSKWDALLKYNGISNPFSIMTGDLMYAIPFASLESVYTSPRDISERGEASENIISRNIEPSKDKNRVDNLAIKAAITTGANGELPPNISKAGDKNIKIKDGRLILGEDVTTINKDNCPIPISRARLQTALLKDKLFL